MSVISNTTLLSNFARINQLSILNQLYKTLYISTQVYEEILEGKREGYNFCTEITKHISPLNPDGWLHLTSLGKPQEVSTYAALPSKLHPGESSCLAIAQHRNWLFLTDDKAARNAAKKYKIRVSGTIGCLILAVNQDLLNLTTANQYLREMIEFGYYSPFSKLDDFFDM